MAKPILNVTPISTCVRTVRMALAEKGVNYYHHVDVGNGSFRASGFADS